MPTPIALGIIVPSSNTSLEPLSQALVSSISTPERPVTVHFTRIAVTQLNLSSGSNSQFTPDALLRAAQLLADAKVSAIGWSGTSAGWLGFSNDEQLCRLIQEKLGVPATTSTLALNKILKFAKVQRLGLVTPYTEDMNEQIMENYSTIGFPISKNRERHLDITENLKIAEVDEQVLHDMVRDVVREGADAVTTFCTNWNAAHLVDRWEKEFGIPVFDSVATVIWDVCRMTGIDMTAASHWGRMFF